MQNNETEKWAPRVDDEGKWKCQWAAGMGLIGGSQQWWSMLGPLLAGNSQGPHWSARPWMEWIGSGCIWCTQRPGLLAIGGILSIGCPCFSLRLATGYPQILQRYIFCIWPDFFKTGYSIGWNSTSTNTHRVVEVLYYSVSLFDYC